VAPEGKATLACALAPQEHDPLIKVDVVDVQPARLGDAGPDPVEDLKERRVAHAPRGLARPRGGDKRDDAVIGDGLGESLRGLGGAPRTRRVTRRDALEKAKAMETPHRDDAAGDRSGAECGTSRYSTREVDREVCEVRRRHGVRSGDSACRAPLGIARQITAVRRDRVARQAAFDDEVVEVVPDRALQWRGAQARTSSTVTVGMPKASATAE
jgi:hypothetical protein